MEITNEKLEQMLDAYIERVFSKNFSFRPQQKDAILDIIRVFLEGECNLYLLDAPLGSGKSLIAMITAGFLSEMKMKGYILASDLMLQTQYEKDFNKYRLQWGSIKGVDNYDCIVNHEKFSLGECKIKNVSYEEAESKPCFKDCGYLFNRRLAINSPVALLNYSYHLIQMNYVLPKMIDSGKNAPFIKRDFTICDEAHKITSIVQNHFSPKVDDKTIEKLEKIRSICIKHNLYMIKTTAIRLKVVVRSMFSEDDKDRIYALLKEFESQLLDFLKAGKAIKDHVSSVYKNIEIPKEWKYNMGLIDWLKDVHCKIEDYNHIISQAGIHTLIKNPQGEQIIFNCIDESYMMEKHFHTQCGFKVLMSGTLGDPSIFLKNIGATNARYFRMESHFNYEKSPIFLYPNKKMSKMYKDSTMPWLIAKINSILDENLDENGIIHSGSYEISSKIFDGLSKENKRRILTYQGSQEKEMALSRLLTEKGTVLMGPSLLEGLDLKDDRSRFQIFAKVPYPSLGDRFVKAKIDYNPEWYNWTTICSILQGIGRSVRNDEDYALTYILDGCIIDLLRKNRSSFPPEIQKRIKIIKE